MKTYLVRQVDRYGSVFTDDMPLEAAMLVVALASPSVWAVTVTDNGTGEVIYDTVSMLLQYHSQF